MSLQTTISLETLRCISQRESSGSEPYIWPFLASMATGPGTFDTTPGQAILADSRKVIASSMKAGTIAPLIFPGNVLAHSFVDGQSECTSLLVVALMEADDSRIASMQAGYQAFLNELRAQLGHKFLSLKTATAEERDALIEEIRQAVNQKAYDAVRNSLSPYEKAKIFVGAMDADDFLSVDYALFENIESLTTPAKFTLSLIGNSNETLGNEFEIDGVLNVAHIEANPCQAEVDSVAAATQAIDALQRQIQLLQGQLHSATPQQKAAIIKTIDKIRSEQIPAAEENLRHAEGALRRCQMFGAGHGPLDQPGVTPIVG